MSIDNTRLKKGEIIEIIDKNSSENIRFLNFHEDAGKVLGEDWAKGEIKKVEKEKRRKRISNILSKTVNGLNYFTTPALLGALTLGGGVSTLQKQNHPSCPVMEPNGKVTNNLGTLENVRENKSFALEKINSDITKFIFEQKPRFGTLFWGKMPFDYESVIKLMGEDEAKLLVLIYSNEFFSEGSGLRSGADYLASFLKWAGSVGRGQVNPLFLLDINILDRVIEFIRSQDEYRYLDNFLPKIEKIKIEVKRIQALERKKVLLEEQENQSSENLQKIENLEKEIYDSKEEAAQYLRNYLGKTFDVKCGGVSEYQPLNQLFSMALIESMSKMSENFLLKIGFKKDTKIFNDLKAFMTIISYKQGPNYAREIMTHNIVIALQEKFGQDLSFQKNISDKKRKLYSKSVLGRKKREDRLVTGLENISEAMVSWQENPPEENSELYPLYKKLEKISEKNPDFLNKIKENLKHLRSVINDSDKNLGKAKDEKDGDDIIKVFRYVYNQEGKLVQKYPEFEELVNLLGEHITEKPEILESMLTIKGLKNSNSKNPIYVGNYFLHALLNYKKAEKKYTKKQIHAAVAKVVDSRFTK